MSTLPVTAHFQPINTGMAHCDLSTCDSRATTVIALKGLTFSKDGYWGSGMIFRLFRCDAHTPLAGGAA